LHIAALAHESQTPLRTSSVTPPILRCAEALVGFSISETTILENGKIIQIPRTTDKKRPHIAE
jgi:hypothetical protein